MRLIKCECLDTVYPLSVLIPLSSIVQYTIAKTVLSVFTKTNTRVFRVAFVVLEEYVRACCVYTCLFGNKPGTEVEFRSVFVVVYAWATQDRNTVKCLF